MRNLLLCFLVAALSGCTGARSRPEPRPLLQQLDFAGQPTGLRTGWIDDPNGGGANDWTTVILVSGLIAGAIVAGYVLEKK